ncbi:MAG TPA: LLM class flavin-dependent oxidoreductase [Acidimicrobiales bacterium]|jgi:alkanesulfonate monooxygenase SsuD/methylene tetrahydromethanopterin reductase-like flavin-dependent oxidoreductase (luciferase family)|nr:LLM class flavin-dependent oxidoreductase [Acidimicrobiales bacterium]
MQSPLEFWLFLPQMRLTMDQLVIRARAAEAAGFAGIAGMDHLTPPLADDQPMFEAMITSAWLAGRTEELRIGSLVLCDSFRHPAVLARQAVSIDHASGGRFELGIGWGSVADEFATFGIGSPEPKVRLSRLRESLEIITALWTGERVDYEGEHFTLRGAQQVPGPVEHIPIVIGGAGKGTMQLVAAHADWWNVHTHIVDRLDEMRPLAGKARCSLQVQVAFVPPSGPRDEIEAAARRRFGSTPQVGTAPELVDFFGSLQERGVERVYAWFCDFAAPDTLAAFGETVIRELSPVAPSA